VCECVSECVSEFVSVCVCVCATPPSRRRSDILYTLCMFIYIDI
jgi:hypothetical protein